MLKHISHLLLGVMTLVLACSKDQEPAAENKSNPAGSRTTAKTKIDPAQRKRLEQYKEQSLILWGGLQAMEITGPDGTKQKLVNEFNRSKDPKKTASQRAQSYLTDVLGVAKGLNEKGEFYIVGTAPHLADALLTCLGDYAISIKPKLTFTTPDSRLDLHINSMLRIPGTAVGETEKTESVEEETTFNLTTSTGDKIHIPSSIISKINSDGYTFQMGGGSRPFLDSIRIMAESQHGSKVKIFYVGMNETEGEPGAQFYVVMAIKQLKSQKEK